MTFSLSLLAMAAFSYMLLLFFVAYATDQGWIPKQVATHPLTFSLSLGVYATSWSYYGSVGFAEKQGYNFLSIYVGVTLAFLLAPIILMPLLRLTREYQLTSLADLFAFRYRSQVAGIIVTLFALVGVLPYLALQIRAVTESIYILTKEASPDLLALGFCVFLIVFSILFGARHVRPGEKHKGLVVAIAFETVVKLLALMLVGLTALFGVWGGFAGLTEWLQANPQALDALYQPVKDGPWNTLLLLAFAAAFLLPRQYHMIFAENNNPHALLVASWAFPLILLLLNLPIPLVLWAGQVLRLDMPADYYVLGVALAEAGRSPLPVLAFIGGISAASAMMIVTTLALASMCLNHFLLAASYPDPTVDLYRWLLWGRRVLIALIVMAGYGFYLLLEHNQGLVQLGLISFVAVAQFLPGIVGVLFWRRATREGFITGLLAGIAVWGGTLLLPLLAASGIISYHTEYFQPTQGQDKWTYATFWSLTINTLLFVVVSLLTRQREAEHEAAHACCSDSLGPPTGTVVANTVAQFKNQLSRIIGEKTAVREVNRALNDLGMDQHDKQLMKLRRLREQIERNLSGLIGPQLAHVIVNQRLKLMVSSEAVLGGTISYVEQRLDQSRTRLRGLAAELDLLHRFHRQILLDLPLGVCALSYNKEVLIWNLALEGISGLKASQVVGSQVEELPSPWGELLNRFSVGADNHVHRMRLQVDNQPRWLNLHKALIIELGNQFVSRSTKPRTGVVMLLEDLTELETLEEELVHSERLASIGRLAAGVAHEIGNPVTGIASLAQNLRYESDPAEVNISVQQILEQTHRITSIVRSLTAFSHGGTKDRERESFGLHELVEEAVQLVRLSHRGRQMQFSQSGSESLMVVGERQRLLQVVVNLLTNAYDASEPGAPVQVIIDRVNSGVEIVIKDQGQGIVEQNLEHVFEPFFTTKRPGEGTGLGLSLVYRIVQDHEGKISVESEVGKGTRVSIWLPYGEQ
ncbi:MAG: histidine kinase [Gammaproteobacteria bacterium]|nr:histidine kinase [Gammaproteobacteria bacterium]